MRRPFGQSIKIGDRLIDVRLRAVVLLVLGTIILGWVANAAAEPQPQPAFAEFNNIQEVDDGFTERAVTVLRSHACDREGDYTTFLNELDKKDFKNQGENLTSILIAKIGLKYMNRGCGRDERFWWKLLSEQVNFALMKYEDHGQLGTSGLPCLSDPAAIYRFMNDPEAIKKLLEKGDLKGSFSTEGEYDVTVRELIRVLFLGTQGSKKHPEDANMGSTSRVFGLPGCESEGCSKTTDYIVTELLTTKGGLSRHSYNPFTDCGNQDRNTDSPEDYADRLDWTERAVDDLVESGEWLLEHLWVLLVFLAPAVGVLGGLAAATSAPGIGFLGAAAVVMASPIMDEVPFFRIPESENHLLMIESSRYLTNQFMLEHYLQQHPNKAKAVAEQKEVEDWLLEKMRRIVQYDFEEYNARPYQRYSLNSILNLYDFATHPKMREAAKAVLEMADAKFAAGSNRGRRFSPLQRLAECDGTGENEKQEARKLYNLAACNDHQISRFMALTGQVQLLPLVIGQQDVRIGKHELPAGNSDLVNTMTSTYRLRPEILEMAVGKKGEWSETTQKLEEVLRESTLQIVHHQGVEVYYSTPSFLLSAGGIQTPAKNTVLGVFSNALDKGIAMESVFIPTAGGLTLDDLIRFKGTGIQDNRSPNTCVHRNVMCGVNLEIPKHIYTDACKEEVGNWIFINSASCEVHEMKKESKTPQFFLAAWRQPCPQFFMCDDLSLREGNVGLIEVIEAPREGTALIRDGQFAVFKSRVMANNNPGVVTRGTKFRYVTSDSRQVEFEMREDNDEGSPRVIKVDQNDIVSYPFSANFMEGDFMNSIGDGHITITGPINKQKHSIDLHK